MAARAGKAERRKDRGVAIGNGRRMLLKEYLMKETHRAGFGGLDIQRTPMGTRVTLIAERPGLVIGRKGAAGKALTGAGEGGVSRCGRPGPSTVRRIMEAGAKGCLVVVAGKLTGQRHRRQKFKAGHIKYCGEPRNSWMRKGFAVAKLKPGVIGVTVGIMDPDAK